MAKALVTGVAGFLGSHVADRCLDLGMDVVGIDDLSGGYVENVPAGVDFRRGSITDHDWMDAVCADGNFNYIYHLAAYAAEGLSHFIRVYNYRTNLLASVNLINNAVRHGVKCFVFTSSIAVYGSNQTPMSEDMTPHPEDPYGISKYAVELDLAAAQQLFGLPYVIFRPHNVYGDRQNIADRYRNVIGIFMNQAMKGEPMTVFGDGLQTRAFSHIDNVAPVIARAPLVPEALQEIFNIGADRPYTVLELAAEVSRAFGVSPRVEHLPARQEVAHAFASHVKAVKVFGAHQSVELGDGLTRMAAWARVRGPRQATTFDSIEVTLNLPWTESSPPTHGS